MRTRSRIATGVALLSACAAIAAPAAQADSIAYVKDGNVHLATPDGSRTFQVTDRGGYIDVSQADDGTMIALNGTRLHRLNRMGDVLADFATPVSGTVGNPSGFRGPYNPAISPDGTKVAYTYFWSSTTQDPTCFPPQCVIALREGGTGYTWADRLTGWDDPALGKHSGWLFPTWIDNDNTVLSYPTHAWNPDVIQDQISDGDSGNLVRDWFSDQAVTGLTDITRDKRKIAYQTGIGNDNLTVAFVPTFPTTWRDGKAHASEKPIVCYRYSGAAGGKYSGPTFSPDGGGLAYADADGIHVAAVPAFAEGCTTDGATDQPPVVIPGGTEPDWGPADVPADRPAKPAGPQPGANTGQSTGPVTPVKRESDPRTTRTRTVRLSAKSLRTALRKGLRVPFAAPSDGRLSATASIGGRQVAKAQPKAVKAGRHSVRLTFSSRAKRTLRARRGVRLTVRFAFTPASGAGSKSVAR